MKLKQFIVLVVFCICFVTLCDAQHRRYRIQNGIGLTGGISQFDLITDNFNTKAGGGWMLGATATVDLPNKWYNLSYVIQLTQNTFDIETRTANTVFEETETEYKIFTAHIGLIGHLKLIKNYVTIDVGPLIQYNSNLELEDSNHEDYFIQNYNNLRAEEIEDISNFNVSGLAGISVGFERFKLTAHYVYGFLNTLNNLNNEDLDTTGGESSFKGNQSMLLFGAVIIL